MYRPVPMANTIIASRITFRWRHMARVRPVRLASWALVTVAANGTSSIWCGGPGLRKLLASRYGLAGSMSL
jgi:hypothetical protein